jgi:UPF0755 protein
VSRPRVRAGIVALFLFLALCIAAAVTAYRYLGPYRAFGSQAFVEIDRGMSSQSIAKELARDGVVRSPWAFLTVRALHPGSTLQAGEYRFDSALNTWQVFDKIHRGEVFYEEFTVPEGSNIFDIANLLAAGDTVRPADFLKAAADPEPIRDLDPVAPDLEGYLFPSTYRITHKTTARQLCRILTGEFRKQWSQLASPSDNGRVHSVVTLASLVEKESAIPAERPLIAGVFANRLRLSMPLQCDPTTVYAALLEDRYRGVIHRSDLASANPYNTYTHPGLPPGPITNPGRSALQAALAPAQNNYLYFVAKPDGAGSHTFSATLSEHEKAVALYRGHTP